MISSKNSGFEVQIIKLLENVDIPMVIGLGANAGQISNRSGCFEYHLYLSLPSLWFKRISYQQFVGKCLLVLPEVWG